MQKFRVLVMTPAVVLLPASVAQAKLSTVKTYVLDSLQDEPGRRALDAVQADLAEVRLERDADHRQEHSLAPLGCRTRRGI